VKDIKATTAEFLNWRRSRSAATLRQSQIAMPKTSRYGGSGGAEKEAWEFSTGDAPAVLDLREVQ
jgi:hypothetical protein